MELIEKRIEKIKEEILTIGPMRPGSLTCQYKDPKEKTGTYWQISYTRTMKSRSDYVRADSVEGVQKEVANYKRFKALTDEWVDLAIESSNLRPTRADARNPIILQYEPLFLYNEKY